jgi:hypothetical protein
MRFEWTKQPTRPRGGCPEVGPDESVIRRSRRFVLDGKPVLLSVSYLPGTIANGTPIAQENTGPGGIYARLRDLGCAHQVPRRPPSTDAREGEAAPARTGWRHSRR